MNIRLKSLALTAAITVTAACTSDQRRQPMAAEPMTAKPSSEAIMRDRMAPIAPSAIDMLPTHVGADRENYAALVDNPVHLAGETPVSTFSIDVDTGAYSNVRRWLRNGQLPPQDAIRIEEMINYFDYSYQRPSNPDTPFVVHTETGPAPWNERAQLLKIGIQGYEVEAEAIPAANLVFLIDVSGSMNSPDKLGLLKQSIRLLVRQLDQNDRIAVVVYAGAAGVVLQPTPGNRGGEIMAAIDRLQAGGSTNGAAGIDLAYQLARQGYVQGGVNRILLATDGDFNVGTTNFEALIGLIERQRNSGVELTTLGFGTGNYNDHLMEQLADAGNGNYAYIDTASEARKVLVDELSSTLFTIARDVKIQIEFNPAVVSEYRLIGYSNRMLKREDFNNDQVDAGDIGAGHTVTALYEVVLQGDVGYFEPLRYSPQPELTANNEEWAFLKLRFKRPGQDSSELLEIPVTASTHAPSEDFKFAAAVAAFGDALRGGRYIGQFDWQSVAELAASARGNDPYGYRSEFLQLVHTARALSVESVAINQ